jgi:excisionase family DNA binding protein
MFPTTGPKSVLTIKEVSDFFKVSERTVYRWLADGLITAIRVGNVTRIRREDLEAFIEAHSSRTPKGQSRRTEAAA